MPTVARRKFAKPPVKVACLACRTSRTRCDGKETCSSCASKGKKCLYTPSKRGGPRKKKSPTSQPQETPHSNVTASASVAAVSDPQHAPWEPMLVPNQDFDNSNMFNQFDSLGMPAAGLKQLDFPVDVHSMFQDMLVPSQRDASQVEPGVQDVPIAKKPNVRVYDSEEDILNAYYVFIHSYFPILPPPTSALTPDRPIDYAGETSDSASKLNVPYEPSSPLSLAISAILALVPRPRDPKPSSGEAVLLRRSTAEDFAQAAIGNIEADSELVESATQPSQALQNPNPSILRKPFHSGTPLELEGILALLILSIYEYAQRGNLKRMRSRAGQAYVMAMDMSLHSLGAQDDEFSEARRRAWWMTFYCVCQGSIVSTTPPTILVNDSRFVTPYPRFAADSEGWYILLQAQEALVSATQYILELNRCLKSRSNMPYIYDRMQKLNGWAESILQKADSFPPTIPGAGSSYTSEATTAQSIRCISRIKLCSARIKTHRFRAFSDIPIFIQRHCDLTAAGGIDQDDKSTSHEPQGQDISKLSCSCSSFEMLPSTTKAEYMPSPSSSTSSTSMTPLPPFFGPGFPFSVEYSATVCLNSALMAAEMFHSLPFPEPFYQDGFPQHPPGSESKPSLVLPRTMPSFACCAMQSSYAMLMLYYRARVSQPQDPERAREWILRGPIGKIQNGLEQVIDSVRNYSIAFEALDGMRDEIEGAFETAFRHC